MNEAAWSSWGAAIILVCLGAILAGAIANSADSDSGAKSEGVAFFFGVFMTCIVTGIVLFIIRAAITAKP